MTISTPEMAPGKTQVHQLAIEWRKPQVLHLIADLHSQRRPLLLKVITGSEPLKGEVCITDGLGKLFLLVGYWWVLKFDRGAGTGADGWSVLVTCLIRGRTVWRMDKMQLISRLLTINTFFKFIIL